MKPREFWIKEGHDGNAVGFVFDAPETSMIKGLIHVQEVLPNDPDYKALAQELVKTLEVAYKTFHILCATSLSSANTPPAMEMMSEALSKARKAGIE